MRRYSIVFATATLTLAYVVALVIDEPYWLRGVNWVWKRRVPSPSLFQLAPLAILFLVWLWLLLWAVRRDEVWPRSKLVVLLGCACLLTPLSQQVIAAQHTSQPLSVAFLTTISSTSGFYSVGVNIDDPSIFIREHAAQMPKYAPIHLRTQPPGWPIAFWTARELWQHVPRATDWLRYRLVRYDCLSPKLQAQTPEQIASATLGMSILLWSGLGVFPLYWLGKAFYSAQIGRAAAVFYSIMPGLLTFQARVDVLYAVLAIFALWLAYRGVSTGRQSHFALLALLLVTISFLGTVMAAIAVQIIIFALVFVGSQLKGRTGWNRLILLCLWIGGFALVAWVGVWLLWGGSWWQWFINGRIIHHRLRIIYPFWPLFNLYDFGVFLGLPLFAWAVIAAVTAMRHVVSGEIRPGDAFSLSWFITLLLMNATGEIRAETGRIWLFLMIPALLAGVAGLISWSNQIATRKIMGLKWPIGLMAVLFGMQALVAGVYLGARVERPRTPPAQWTVPASAERVSYRFGDTIALQGYELREKGDRVVAKLYWRTLKRPDLDYSAFVHRVDDGQLISQDDGTPAKDGLPIWCWVPGEVIADKRILTGPTAGDGNQQLAVGLYDYRTGARLPVEPPVPDQTIYLPLTHQSP